MVLKCQEDSFLKQFSTRLLECIEDEFLVSIAPGTQKKVKGIGVVVEDTILFPEGGGQPCDEGLIGIKMEDGKIEEVKVVHVFRYCGKVVHLVEERWDIPWLELPQGTCIFQTLSWSRRNYHMKQHSGQHLISALAENMYQLETLSWCLGQDSSYIELGTEQITEDQYNTLEYEANRNIDMDLRVISHVYKEGDAGLKEAKTRGLPEDHVGDIRVIEIEGVDKNMCCGTHVSSLGQLQVIKFLKTGKKIFKKNKTCLLYFVVGREKVFNKFDSMLKREDAISAILNKPPEEHVSTVHEIKESLGESKKAVKELQKEIAMLMINNFKQVQSSMAFFSFHRADGDLDLLNFICRQFKGMNVVLFLSIGEEDEGNILLEGPKELIANLAPRVSSLLVGKGQISGNRFQARVIHLSARKRVEDLIRDSLTTCPRSA